MLGKPRSISRGIVVALLLFTALAAGCSRQPTVVQVTATPLPTPPPTPTPVPTSTTEDVNVLVMLADFYGANTQLNLDNFDLFGWNVTLTGVQETIRPCRDFAAQHGCPGLEVDVLVSEIADVTAYDALLLMPASRYVRESFGDLLGSQDALDLLATAAEEGLVVYGTCTGQRVLNAAGLAQDLQVLDSAQPVIADNIVVTRRGAYNHIPNCNAIATALENVLTEVDINHELNTVSDSAPLEGAVWARTLGGPNAEGGRGGGGGGEAGRGGGRGD
jgi:hypothetical protein